jgi:predicted DNA-binding transcriptional regulator AlpA
MQKPQSDRSARVAAAAAVRAKTEHFVVPVGDRMISGREVCKIRGLRSRMTLWRHIRAGTIPKPDATIHGRHYWLASRIGGAA